MSTKILIPKSWRCLQPQRAFQTGIVILASSPKPQIWIEITYRMRRCQLIDVTGLPYSPCHYVVELQNNPPLYAPTHPFSHLPFPSAVATMKDTQGGIYLQIEAHLISQSLTHVPICSDDIDYRSWQSPSSDRWANRHFLHRISHRPSWFELPFSNLVATRHPMHISSRPLAIGAC